LSLPKPPMLRAVGLLSAAAFTAGRAVPMHTQMFPAGITSSRRLLSTTRPSAYVTCSPARRAQSLSSDRQPRQALTTIRGYKVSGTDDDLDFYIRDRRDTEQDRVQEILHESNRPNLNAEINSMYRDKSLESWAGLRKALEADDKHQKALEKLSGLNTKIDFFLVFITLMYTVLGALIGYIVFSSLGVL
jgi:hypothetical protein